VHEPPKEFVGWKKEPCLYKKRLGLQRIRGHEPRSHATQRGGKHLKGSLRHEPLEKERTPQEELGLRRIGGHVPRAHVSPPCRSAHLEKDPGQYHSSYQFSKILHGPGHSPRHHYEDRVKWWGEIQRLSPPPPMLHVCQSHAQSSLLEYPIENKASRIRGR